MNKQMGIHGETIQIGDRVMCAIGLELVVLEDEFPLCKKSI